MAKGIIYAMTTVVPGLVKIGKTGCGNFEQRMYNLERNGYFNVVGLKRRFAIEVEDYDEKEALLDEIFSKSRVPGSELFALDIDLVIQLLSSLEGKQVYPEEETKEDAFNQATEQRSFKDGWSRIPDGEYTMSRKIKGVGTAEAVMVVGGGKFTVRAGARCMPDGGSQVDARAEAQRADRGRHPPGGRRVRVAVDRGLGRPGPLRKRVEDREGCLREALRPVQGERR